MIGMIVTPEELTVSVEGWVSNSRVASHAIPRWARVVGQWQVNRLGYSRRDYLQ